VEVVKKRKAMKKYLIHTISVLISFMWLVLTHHTFNPISLKGPAFLTFYLILLLGFYSSVFALKLFKETISKVTFYFMISIFLLGIIKLVRGIFLGKPIGFLIIILILEFAVLLYINLFQVNDK